MATMKRSWFAASLALAAAGGARGQWINWEHEDPRVLETTEFASSAVRTAESYRIAADDFEIDHRTFLSEIVFYSVETGPSDIIGADWYIYEFDEATGKPGDLIAGAADAYLQRWPSGWVNDKFGTIYHNSIDLVGRTERLRPGRYFIAFRTHCGPGAGDLANAPLHPEWSHGAATAHWNDDVREDGTALGAWVPMTTFHPTPKEWAFEVHPFAACYLDCDGNDQIDYFDFLCFLKEFAAGEAYADCDQSGVLDFFDFLCFQYEFSTGSCP